MDEKLSTSLGKIKQLVSEGKKEDALDEVNKLINDSNMKPYESALKKIKVDIIYALNLERINTDLGKKAYEKVASELDSALSPSEVPPSPSAPGKQAAGAPVSHAKPITSPPPQLLPPFPPLPVMKIKVPEVMEKDPYDIDNIDILDEVGPMGVINDMRRTFASLFDPALPVKLFKKEVKK